MADPPFRQFLTTKPPASSQCREFLAKACYICLVLLLIKSGSPTFLGIEIDSDKCQLCLPVDKLYYVKAHFKHRRI
jgi:hypothetical protein